eukprot:403344092
MIKTQGNLGFLAQDIKVQKQPELNELKLTFKQNKVKSQIVKGDSGLKLQLTSRENSQILSEAETHYLNKQYSSNLQNNDDTPQVEIVYPKEKDSNSILDEMEQMISFESENNQGNQMEFSVNSVEQQQHQIDHQISNNSTLRSDLVTEESKRNGRWFAASDPIFQERQHQELKKPKKLGNFQNQETKKRIVIKDKFLNPIIKTRRIQPNEEKRNKFF